MARNQYKPCLSIRTLVNTGFTVPVLLIGAVALFAWAHEDPEPISAFAANVPDADGDGVRDEFEASMFTDMNSWDSDGDTWSDAEEFSMKTNPRNATLFPITIPRLRTNLTARGHNGRLHVMCAAYFMDGQNVAGAHFELAMMLGTRYRKLSTNYLAIHGESHSIVGRPSSSKIAFFEISFPEAIIPLGQRMTFMAMLTLPGEVKPTAVTVLDVIKDAGSGVLLVEYPTDMLPDQPGRGPLPGGSVYLPIPTSSTGPTGAIPVTWKQSRICFKGVTTVGRSGALLIQEVTRATCVPGFDGFCAAPVCANTLGEQFQTIDPLVLVGPE